MSLILFTISSAQVGINTTTPNGATVLDINSNAKGLLIPRLTDAERNTSLADNTLATVPPAGVFNSALAKGTLIFNTTSNRFEFWDGFLWRQLFVATSSAAGNDGVVKIDGTMTPTTITLSAGGNSFGAETQLAFTTPLVFAAPSTTSWPETVGPVGSAAVMTPLIYDSATKKFRENQILGQVHLWRLIIKMATGASSAGAIMATMRNPVSLFEVNSIQQIPSGSSSGNFITFNFLTIADEASVGYENPPTNTIPKGYQIFLKSDKDASIEFVSLTRVSLFKD